MLEHPTSPQLTHGSATADHAAMRARSAVTASVRCCVLAVGPSFGPLAFDLFLYFLNIFKSLQIQKFV
jgi:hypothetical protein